MPETNIANINYIWAISRIWFDFYSTHVRFMVNFINYLGWIHSRSYNLELNSLSKKAGGRGKKAGGRRQEETTGNKGLRPPPNFQFGGSFSEGVGIL
ncbi:hypothetical protein NIES4074_01790 [Cylindrospermum sp. NIES-4074]|nr:hypothetical protein NIES4074_01790 [Cylindrospermum sp. NIES-4074]